MHIFWSYPNSTPHSPLPLPIVIIILLVILISSVPSHPTPTPPRLKLERLGLRLGLRRDEERRRGEEPTRYTKLIGMRRDVDAALTQRLAGALITRPILGVEAQALARHSA